MWSAGTARGRWRAYASTPRPSCRSARRGRRPGRRPRSSAAPAPRLRPGPRPPAWGEAVLRPLRLFDPPEPLSAVLYEAPDQPPARFTWRRVAHTVGRAEGPERLAPGGWRGGGPARLLPGGGRGRPALLDLPPGAGRFGRPGRLVHARAVRVTARATPAPLRPPADGPAYVELAAASCFSFLRGASWAHEMVGQAYELGHAGAAIADRNTVAGVVRAHVAAKAMAVTLDLGEGGRSPAVPAVRRRAAGLLRRDARRAGLPVRPGGVGAAHSAPHPLRHGGRRRQGRRPGDAGRAGGVRRRAEPDPAAPRPARSRSAAPRARPAAGGERRPLLARRPAPLRRGGRPAAGHDGRPRRRGRGRR